MKKIVRMKKESKMIYFTKMTVRSRRGQKREGTEADKGLERTQSKEQKETRVGAKEKQGAEKCQNMTKKGENMGKEDDKEQKEFK